MRENWKINIGGCVCFLGKREDESLEVFFAPPDRKRVSKTVVKLVESVSLSNFTEIWIDDYDKFRLKISPNSTLLCQHPSFPNVTEWYPVRNWMIELPTFEQQKQLGEYIVNSTIVNGEIEGNFTPLFDPEFERSVNFISEKLPDWEEKQGEILRRMSFELGKKTTKWIPGHKYISETDSYWYLGEVYQRVVNRGSLSKEFFYLDNNINDFKSVISPSQAYLTKAPANPLDFWDNVVISFDHSRKDLNYFDLLTKRTKVVDSGEWLSSGVDPWGDPKEWRLSMMKRILENVCQREKEIGGVKSYTYVNLHLALEPLLLYLGENDEIDLEKIGEYVKPLLYPVILRCYEQIISLNLNELGEKSNQVLDWKVNYLKSSFLNEFIRDSFCNKKEIFNQLFSKIGLPLEDIAKDLMGSFKLNDRIGKDWSTFLKNVMYLEGNPTTSNRYIDLRTKKQNEYLYREGVSTDLIKKSLSDESISSNTKDMIVDMIMWSIKNNNLGLTKFWKNKYGEQEITITLEDIINRYHKHEGVDVPDNYKQGILEDKIWKVSVFSDSKVDWKDQ